MDPISRKKYRSIPGARPTSTRALVTMVPTTSFPMVPTASRAVRIIAVILPVGRSERGFSLIELILVLLLIAVSLSIVLPNIGRGLQEREVRSSALGLAAAARDLRSRALFDGVPQQLVVNVPQNSYLVARSREVQLPAEV